MPDVVVHALILADSPHASTRVAGLTLRERACRVAAKVGAVRVMVVDRPEDRAGIAMWWNDGIGGDLLVIRASDQLVHTPLVSGLVDNIRAVAVIPGSGPSHAPAGAMIGRDAHAAALARALSDGADDLDVAAAWLADGVRGVEHGTIARHPVTSPAERRAAERHLFKIIHKPQDNVITRFLFRPVSRSLTAVAVRTPITPNQVSYLTAIMVALGVWFTVDGQPNHAVIGALIILAATYVDCVDGEVARLKLMSSKLGSWLDTIIDEVSTVAQLAALGWHCHLWLGQADNSHLALSVDGWMIAMAIGVVCSVVSIYCVYYNIIVLIGSANSQDYVARFEVVPAGEPHKVRLQPVRQATAEQRERHVVLRWMGAVLPHVIRRDFVVLGVVALTALQLTYVAFGTIALGSVVTCAILCVDHYRIRRLRRDVARRGQILVA